MRFLARCALLTITVGMPLMSCSAGDVPEQSAVGTERAALSETGWPGARFEQVLRVNPDETHVRNRCEMTLDLEGPVRPLTFIATTGGTATSVGWKGTATANGKLSVSGCVDGVTDPCVVQATWRATATNGSAAACQLTVDDGEESHTGTSTGTALTVDSAPSSPVIFNESMKIHSANTKVAGRCIFRQSAELPDAEVTDLGVFVNGGQVLDMPGPTAIGDVPYPTKLNQVPFGAIYRGSATKATRLKHVTPVKEHLDSNDVLRCDGSYYSAQGDLVYDVNVTGTPVGNGMSIARGDTGWTCSLGMFGRDDICQCDCGILDPDCQPCDTGEPGICAAGMPECVNGSLTCVQQNQAESVEYCGNGEDDDCNGPVDDGCTCSSGTYNCDGWAGCECTVGTGCCAGGTCESQHDTGLGQNFYACGASGTWGVDLAFAACEAFTGDISKCIDYGLNCDSDDDLVDDTSVVCGDTDPGGDCACWAYSGGAVGHVYNYASSNECFCPLPVDPAWD